MPPKALFMRVAKLAVKLAPLGQEHVGAPLKRPQAPSRDPRVLEGCDMKRYDGQ